MRLKPIILFLVIILVGCQSNRDKKLYEDKLEAFEVFADSLKSVPISAFTQEKVNNASDRLRLLQDTLNALSDTSNRNHVTPTVDQLIRYRQALIDIRQVLVNWVDSKDQ